MIERSRTSKAARPAGGQQQRKGSQQPQQFPNRNRAALRRAQDQPNDNDYIMKHITAAQKSNQLFYNT
jgi:hypothetical protein